MTDPDHRQAAAGPPGQTRVLLIDDDRKLARLIQEYFRPLGYQVDAAHTGPDGLERAAAGDYQAIILDVMLPGLDGLEVLKRLRRDSNVPVIMLTARGEEPDRIVGLEIGADDYLPKTCSPRELLARLRAVTRRAARAAGPDPAGADPEVVVGSLRINPSARVAMLGEQVLELTPLEFDLLTALARARGRVKTREQLLEAIADRNYDVYDRSIDVHISCLRRKLGDDPREPRFIRTVRSAGYMLIHPGASA